MDMKKIAIFVVGALFGAGAVWTSCREDGDSSVEGSAFWRTSRAIVWYRSHFEGEGRYRNEFHFRKLCGDSERPCGPWVLGAKTESDRPYPAKDIEFAEAGDGLLIVNPDGQSIKGDLEKPWHVESAGSPR